MPLANGGRISLQSAPSDEGGPATVRTHMRSIADAFAAGNFDIPGYVHAGKVPGTDVMREKASLIHYQAKDLARGGHSLLHDIVAVSERMMEGFIPTYLIRVPADVNSVSAVVIVGL